MRLHGSCFQCLQINYRIAPVTKIDRMLPSSTLYNLFNSHTYSKTKKVQELRFWDVKTQSATAHWFTNSEPHNVITLLQCRDARKKVGQSCRQCYDWIRTRNILTGCGDAVKWKGWKKTHEAWWLSTSPLLSITVTFDTTGHKWWVWYNCHCCFHAFEAAAELHERGGKTHLAHALAYRTVVGQGKFD
jgi:hypothetical protein